MQVWSYDIVRGALSPVTADGQSGYGIFAPDGKRVVFRSGAAGGEDNLYWKAADGSGAAERLTTSARSQTPGSWSPDGTTLAFVEEGDSTGFFQFDIRVLSIGDRKTRAVVQTAANEMSPEFSPDGRWLAYVSNESGRNEVYVQPYPGPGERHSDFHQRRQINPRGARMVANCSMCKAWVRPAGRQPSCPSASKTTPAFRRGRPKSYSKALISRSAWGRSYDVAPDGRRFLMALDKEQAKESGTGTDDFRAALVRGAEASRAGEIAVIREQEPSKMPPTPRLRSIDVLRGLVMVLMAIDHVRVYSGLPAGGPTAGIFFTRWVTHFCAPAFAFFAGTSAFLYGRRLRRHRRARRAISSRAASCSCVLELTVIRVAWTFNLDFAHYMLAGVIWMLGVCMVLLAALVWLPTTAIAAFGLSVIFAQNLVGVLRATPALPSSGRSADSSTSAVCSRLGAEWARRRRPLLDRAVDRRDGGGLRLRRDHDSRAAKSGDRLCLRIGLSATALFLVSSAAIRASCCSRARSRRAAGAVPLAEPAEVPGVAVVPADDARSDHRAAAARRARPRRRRRRAGRRSAACRCSTTCCTSR